jgi:hypothetical protein
MLADHMNRRDKNSDRVLGHTPAADSEQKALPSTSLKKKDEVQREQVRKRERKSLMKSLEMAQKSTASMGKFDKKATKNEVNLNVNKNKM